VSWNKYHSLSEKLASKAELAMRKGEDSRALELYRQAAAEESSAFNALGNDRERTRGITAVSAVALWYKAHDYSTAEQVAHQYLAAAKIPRFANVQLRDLLQMIWTAVDAEESGIRFVAGDVLVSVRGGQVIHGGAPLDLIAQKVDGIQTALYRTVELILARPFRKRGGPPADIQSMFRPWLFQAPAGSYQFAVRMEEPRQQALWDLGRPRIENVTAKFFNILRAASTNPEKGLSTEVPDKQYREAFLNISRNLAPTGKTFEILEVRDAGAPREPSVTFAATSRQELNISLRKLKPLGLANEGREVKIHGVLRGLHLDKDWLEVTATEPNLAGRGSVRIHKVSAALDDVVGPMVNRKVVVTALRQGSGFAFRDIEVDE
jgi:hypothetical protein